MILGEFRKATQDIHDDIVTTDEDCINTIIKDEKINRITTWQQSKFVDSSRYNNWTDDEKLKANCDEQLKVVAKLKENAICKTMVPEDAKWIAERLNKLAKLENLIAAFYGTYDEREFYKKLIKEKPVSVQDLQKYIINTKNDMQENYSDGYQDFTLSNVKPIGKLKTNNNNQIDMVYVEGGEFQMGSYIGESDEKPIHRVTLSSFYIGKYAVTQKQWIEEMGSNPSYFKGDNLPVERISWYDAVEFCNKLSEKEGLTPVYTIKGRNVTCNWKAIGYRLPTEAEWEFAAKGGNKSKDFTYAGSGNIDEVAWYNSNSGSKTQVVGTKKANELGIYDMSGNVWEWCWDWYASYQAGSFTNPTGPNSDSYRILRGGSWGNFAEYCRSACRHSYHPDYNNRNYGFRVVRNG